MLPTLYERFERKIRQALKKGTFNDPKNPREHFTYKELLTKTLKEIKSHGEVLLLDMHEKSDGNSGLSSSGYDLGESMSGHVDSLLEGSLSRSHSEHHIRSESGGISIRTGYSEVSSRTEFGASSAETEISLSSSMRSAGSGGRMELSDLAASHGGAEDRRKGPIV